MKLEHLLPVDGLRQDEYNLYSLCYAHNAARRIRDALSGRHDFHDGPMPIDYCLWIAHNADRLFLVDVGYSREAARARGRELLHDPVEALETIGIAPGSVTDVVLSHLHCDHAGNLHRFANARLHVQDAEVAFATGRCMCEDALRYPYDLEDVLNLTRRTFQKRVQFHDGDSRLAPGADLLKLPGHAAGLQGVLVNTRRGKVLLASDATHFYPNAMRRIPHVLTTDTVATLATYRRIHEVIERPDQLIPGHDPKVRLAFPTIIANGIALQALHLPPLKSEAAFFESLTNYDIAAPSGPGV